MILYFVKRFWPYVHLKGAIEVLNIINIIINNINEKNLYRPLQARENAWLPDGLSQSLGAVYYAKRMWLVENFDTFSRFYTWCDAIARIKI